VENITNQDAERLGTTALPEDGEVGHPKLKDKGVFAASVLVNFLGQ
jgi:hypothetical protein